MKKLFTSFTLFFLILLANPYLYGANTNICDVLTQSYISLWKQHQQLAADIQSGVYNWSPEILKKYLDLLQQIGDMLHDTAKSMARNQCELPEGALD